MAAVRNPWWVLVAMSLPIFMLTVDINGIAVALPEIGDDLDSSTSGLQWVLNAYMLSLAAFLIPAGRIGDIVGRRLVLVVGALIFGASSLMCGLAPTDETLIVGRAVQGLGAAMFNATSLSIVSNAFTRQERGRAIGIWTAVGATGAAVGPLLGGVLTQFLDWRWFFFINVPVSIATVVLTLLVVDEERDESASRRLDVAGFLLVTIGMLALVFGIQQSDQLGWGSPEVVVSLALSVITIIAFAVLELRLAEPLMDLRLFKQRGYLSAAVVGGLQAFNFLAIAFFATLYLQNVLDLSAGETGVVFLAVTAPFIWMSPFIGRVIDAIGERHGMMLGMFLQLVAAGVLMLCGTSVVEGVVFMAIGFFVFGHGASLAYNISVVAGMSAISESKAGIASGILNAARFAVGAVGIALTGAVFKFVESGEVAKLLDGATPTTRTDVNDLLSGSESAQETVSAQAPALAGQAESIVNDAFVLAFVAAMAFNLVVAAAGMAIGGLYRARGGEATPGRVAQPEAT